MPSRGLAGPGRLEDFAKQFAEPQRRPGANTPEEAARKAAELKASLCPPYLDGTVNPHSLRMTVGNGANPLVQGIKGPRVWPWAVVLAGVLMLWAWV